MHPGYGFLSENESFMNAITEAGVAWLGPTGKTMHDFSLKHVAREIARSAGVSLCCKREGGSERHGLEGLGRQRVRGGPAACSA